VEDYDIHFYHFIEKAPFHAAASDYIDIAHKPTERARHKAKRALLNVAATY
jgi:hypothetical protein